MPEDAKLNFLKMAGPPAKPDDADDAGAPEEGMMAASSAAMAAVEAKDPRAFMEAVRDMFTMMEARPHAEAGEQEA